MNMQVKIPQNAKAGDNLQIPLNNGIQMTMVTITIPNGVKAGDVVNVPLPVQQQITVSNNNNNSNNSINNCVAPTPLAEVAMQPNVNHNTKQTKFFKLACCLLCLLVPFSVFIQWVIVVDGNIFAGLFFIGPQYANTIRLAIQDKVPEAVKTKNFDSIKQELQNTNARHGLLVLGNKDGIFLNLQSAPWIDLNTRLTIHSCTKSITAYAIYRVLENVNNKYNLGNFSLNSRPQDVIPWWSKHKQWMEKDNGPNLQQMMAFTTGVSKGAHLFSGKTMRACLSNTWKTWDDCLQQLATEREDLKAPGTRFVYGPDHLFLAVSMVLYALNPSNVNDAAWIEILKNEVWIPSGITNMDPKFVGKRMDVSGGLQMTANEMSKILKYIHYDDGLSKESLNIIYTDQTTNASFHDAFRFNGQSSYPNQNEGMWHYTQGHWLTCDTKINKNNDFTKGKCKMPGHVLMLKGYGGYNAWIDVDRKYYAIYATEYRHNSLHSAIIAYSVSIISSFLIAYGWVYREDLKSKFSNKCQTKKEQER